MESLNEPEIESSDEFDTTKLNSKFLELTPDQRKEVFAIRKELMFLKAKKKFMMNNFL